MDFYLYKSYDHLNFYINIFLDNFWNANRCISVNKLDNIEYYIQNIIYDMMYFSDIISYIISVFSSIPTVYKCLFFLILL